MVFGRDGMLFVSLGENNRRPTAQDLDKLQGKIVRIKPDGGVPPGNPFAQRAGARAEIWTYGMRIPPGMAINPWYGDLWEHAHGSRGCDEVNLASRVLNYGWPLATYGITSSACELPIVRTSHRETGCPSAAISGGARPFQTK